MDHARRVVALLISAAASTCAVTAAAQVGSGPWPPAPVRNVVDRYFGTEVQDPYRWLEDLKSSETQQWMKATAEQAAASLARIPGRDALLARLAELEAATSARIGRVIRLPGERYVYEQRGANDNQFRLVMRQALTGTERVLVDPVAIAEARGTPVAVNHFSASPDGRYLAYGLSAGGSEAAVLHLLDTRNLQPVGEPIDRADFGVARWSPDSRRFTFNRLRADPAEPKAKYERSAAHRPRPPLRPTRRRGVRRRTVLTSPSA